MELRFILEHVRAEMSTIEKLYYAGDRARCILMLEELGKFITAQIFMGVLEPPNIDVKPPKPD